MPSHRVYHHFEQIASPQERGFENIKPGLYGKRIDEDIVQLINVAHLKGGAYAVCWGVSLSYVPHQWEKKLCWHRTFKSSRLDLFKRSWDYFSPNHQFEDSRPMYAESLHGEIYLHETFSALWTTINADVDEWFKTVTSVDEVLIEASEQMKMPCVGAGRPELIYAFTLAKLGRLEEARSLLAAFISKFNLKSNEEANLLQAILKTRNLRSL